MTRIGPLCENMTSSTKPEVHNLSQRRHKRTEPRLEATCVKNLLMFGCVVFEIIMRVDRQTDEQTYSLQYFTVVCILPVQPHAG